MRNYFPILSPGNFYHVYNRTVNSEKLFITKENHYFFLRKFDQYLGPYTDLYCYCLMPTHFHFLIKVKAESELTENESQILKYGTIESFISIQFSKLFNSYTQAFNKQNGRRGNLLTKNFKRVLVDEGEYLRKLVHLYPYESN